MRAAAELATEVARNAAHVRPLGDVELDGPAPPLGVDAQEARAEDAHATGRELERLAGAGRVVGAPTAHGDGRVGGRDLVALALEPLHDPRGEAAVREELARDLRRARDLALGVIGRGLGPQREGRAIALAVEREQPEELRRLADAHDEHASGGRVERACVPHATLPHRAPHAVDHVMARHARGLVDRQERGEGARAPPAAHRPTSSCA